ncbi:MAG: APC family permease [Crocinitomicaceae bacterium]|nr:APC family permease [Crocinitomicaceae bacterium]
MNTEEIISESEQIKPKEWKGGNPRDFEKLSDEEKQKALTSFNRIFNNGLIFFLFGIMLVMGAYASIWLLAGASFFVFVTWVMSFFALTKLKRIDIDSQPKNIRVKFRLAQVVCGIGVFVCIATIFGGLVLLFLWGVKLI